MINCVESLRQVDGGANRTTRADQVLSLVKVLSNFRGERKKGSDTGTTRGKTMLVRRARERHQRTDQTFEDFGVRTKKGDGTVRGTKVGGFTGFKDREDMGDFPNSGKVRVVYGEIKESGKEGDSLRA